MSPEEQPKKQSPADRLKPWQWKKGQSGNPGGRKKGSKSMKVYAREMLQSLPEEERQEFLNGLPKEMIWKMAEGNPESKDVVDATVKTNLLTDEQLERIIAKRKSSDS